MTAGLRHWRLSGPPAARGAGLDRILVRAEVISVWEADDRDEIAVRGPLPDLQDLAGLEVVAFEPAAADHHRTGLEDDRPVLVAADLLVRPPWVPRPGDFHGFELEVPRGGAFGSGEHGSTQAALLALHRVWPRSAGDLVVADVGTGSGILALYMAQRGAGRVLACDVDPAAVRTAAELLGDRATVSLGGAETLPAGGCDLVVANLDARELAAHLDSVLACWSGRDVLVISGTRPHEVDRVCERVTAFCGAAPGGVVARGDFVAQVWLPRPPAGA